MTDIYVELLPADEGARPWLQTAEVPVTSQGVEVGRASVRPKDGALVADITFDQTFMGEAREFHVNGKIIRDSWIGDVRTILEVQLLSVAVSR